MNNLTSMKTVMDNHLPHYQEHHKLSPQQTKVCHAIQQCRTEKLGGDLVHCNQCTFEQTENRGVRSCSVRCLLDNSTDCRNDSDYPLGNKHE